MIRAPLILITLIAISFVIAASAFHSPSRNRAPIGAVAQATPMLQPRSGHTATLLPTGKVLIAGGMRRNQDFYKSAELYDSTTGKFQPTGDMSVGRVGQVAVLLQSGKVLIAGGWVGHGCTDAAELYDSANGKFTAIAAKMTTRRGDARATLLVNGDVLITGGADHDAPGGVASAEVFRTADLSFHSVQPMHFARVSHTATLLRDGRVLIVGGRGDRVNAIAELYDPKTESFTDTGSLAAPRYKHTAGLLPDGRVLVAGGSDERDWTGNLSSAEIYDPKTAKFSPASSLINSRFKLPEEAVGLESGELLVAGGNEKVEVFDPATGKFTLAAGEISGPWHFMTETKLRDGRVLLAGGYANNDRATAQTWIYKPR
jgi:Kelch motif protein/galactose oxidase-like protein